jgi:hypothetical protein
MRLGLLRKARVRATVREQPMLRTVETLRRAPWGGVAGLALILLAGCSQAADSAASCDAPKSWSESDAKPGRPKEELAACLRDQAYQIRNLAIPFVSATNGIVAQCEVRVDRFEGVTAPTFDAASEQATMQLATDDVTHYRQCVGR